MNLIRQAISSDRLHIRTDGITFGGGALIKDMPYIASSDANKQKVRFWFTVMIYYPRLTDLLFLYIVLWFLYIPVHRF